MFSSITLAATDAAHRFDGGPGPGFAVLAVLVPLLWIGVIALVLALAGRRWRRAAWSGAAAPWGGHPWSGWQAGASARSAEATLAERFAQGDIEEQEYRARLEVLRANAPQPPVPPQPGR